MLALLQCICSLFLSQGELTITADMEDLQNALFLDKVPDSWSKRAYPSLAGLSAWFADLLLRIRELESWVSDFNMPACIWLAGFFNPAAVFPHSHHAVHGQKE